MGCHLLVTCVIQIFLALSGAKTIEESRTEALLAVPEPPKNCSDPKYKTSISLDPPAFTPKELEDARKAALDRHNYYRALHDVPLLTRSLVLETRALHVAECNVKWGQGRRGLKGVIPKPKRGENLIWEASPKPFDLAKMAVKFVDAWYSERCLGKKEDIAHKKFNTSQWHFTQIVWRSTKILGIGFAGSKEKIGGKEQRFLFMVGRYLPLGNSFWEFDVEVGTLKMADDKMCCRGQQKLLADIKKGSDCSVKAPVTRKPTAKPEIPANCARAGYTTSVTLTPPSYSKTEMAAAQKAALDRHNYYRKLHGAPPLKLSEELNALALHAAECNIKWGQAQGKPWGVYTAKKSLGESLHNMGNFVTKNSQSPLTFNLTQEAIAVVDSWYKKYCTGSVDEYSYKKADFQQLIWKSTTQLGIGFASSILLNDPTDPKWKKKFLFVVARYSPRGDYSLNMSSEVGKLKMPDEEMCCRSLGKMRKEGDKNCPTVEKGRSMGRTMDRKVPPGFPIPSQETQEGELLSKMQSIENEMKDHELRIKILEKQMELAALLSLKPEGKSESNEKPESLDAPTASEKEDPTEAPADNPEEAPPIDTEFLELLNRK